MSHAAAPPNGGMVARQCVPLYMHGQRKASPKAPSMRAETERTIDEIKQALSLLRRHL